MHIYTNIYIYIHIYTYIYIYIHIKLNTYNYNTWRTSGGDYSTVERVSGQHKPAYKSCMALCIRTMHLLWMKKNLHQLTGRFSTIQGGSGFLPSTVSRVYIYIPGVLLGRTTNSTHLQTNYHAIPQKSDTSEKHVVLSENSVPRAPYEIQRALSCSTLSCHLRV